ncbi:unnamed protein product [Rhizophagus irregularis]|nr:unnamed protein product [Rhizophagus irregularis]CAB4435556.1 unnamed protein product [Rhizophagus irregularis]
MEENNLLQLDYDSDDNINCRNKPIEITIDKPIESGKALLKYGYDNGFVWVRKRTRPVNGRMAGISFYCDKSGINIPKKIADPTKQRNKKSKKCRCEVHVNISWPQRRSGPYVSLFKNTHNHVLHQDTTRFATAYCKLSNKIFSEIEFYTNAANLDAAL